MRGVLIHYKCVIEQTMYNSKDVKIFKERGLSNMPTPMGGEIWDAYIPKTEDRIESSKQYGRRPVLVISNDKFNKFSPQVNIYPISSKVGKMSPVHVYMEPDEHNGLKSDSVLLVESPDSIPKACLYRKIGEVRDDGIIKRICDAIKLQFSFAFSYAM